MSRESKVLLGYTVWRIKGERHEPDHIYLEDATGRIVPDFSKGNSGYGSSERWFKLDTSDKELMWFIEGFIEGKRAFVGEHLQDDCLRARLDRALQEAFEEQQKFLGME